ETENRAANMGSHIRRLLEKGEVSMHDNIKLQQLFDKTLSLVPLGAPDALSLLNPQLGLIVSAKGERLAAISLPEIPSEALRKAAASQEPEIITRQVPAGELIQAIVPVQSKEPNKTFLVTTLLIPAEKLALMQSVSKGITDYKQLVMLKAPIKLSMIIMLLIITLLILFGAIWFGFFYCPLHDCVH
ncbi:PAS domain-containing sensor histidine kinase, partial [Desulfobulbus sp. US2]|nr:PAS domain-containing sensor histidine kinase [Desulfobulbus sp. US2]